MDETTNSELIPLSEEQFALLAALEWWTWEEAAQVLTGLRHRGQFDKNIYTGGPPAELYRLIKEGPRRFLVEGLERINARQTVTWAITVKHREVPDRIKPLCFSPNELAAATAASEERLRPEGAKAEDKPLQTTERKKLLVIIAAMAKRGFDWDPKDKKSAVAKEIEEAADDMGLSITDDTVRKWLDAAREVIPLERGSLGAELALANKKSPKKK